MRRKSIQVFGWVQGVGFRYYAQRTARYYGVKGFVKNKYDGSVYIEAEAEEKALNEFIKWCYKGSGSAKVENLVILEKTPLGSKSFEIRH